jgi:hypothetical protein
VEEVVAPSTVINSPIFVVGTPRSGTTLTARILGRHSRIFMPGETHFFDDIFLRQREHGPIQDAQTREKIIERLLTLYERYYEPADQRRIDYLFTSADTRAQLITPNDTYCQILSRFMEVPMRYENKARWGNNAPRDIFNIADIVKCYPSAKIIICVRDARDFLVSYRNRWKITSIEHKDRLKALYHPLVTSLLWKSSMRQIPIIKAKIEAENLRMIRYEDLVRDPQKLVRELCAFVDEDFEPDMLNVDTNNSSVQVGGRGIFSSSVGAWRSTLSNEEAYIAQWVNRKELGSFGYALERIRTNQLRLLWILLLGPFAAYRALCANRSMRGSFIAYMYRRLSAFFP